MHAKIKADYRWPTLTAFGGHEYTKRELRPVPAGCEAQAQAHPYLETVEVVAPVELRFSGTIQDGEIGVVDSIPADDLEESGEVDPMAGTLEDAGDVETMGGIQVESVEIDPGEVLIPDPAMKPKKNTQAPKKGAGK